MASKTEIGNRALSKLGEDRVSNIDTDNNKPAKVIRYMWDIVLNSMLMENPWNFAIKRTQLAKDADAPAWGYSNQYTLPSDYLSLLEIDGDPDYRMESGADGGLRIVTNAGAPLKLRYLRKVTNTGEFDPMFTDAFTSRLAYEGCEEITQSNTKKQILAQELQMAMKKAFQADAIQDLPQPIQTDAWINARESSAYTDEIDY